MGKVLDISSRLKDRKKISSNLNNSTKPDGKKEKNKGFKNSNPQMLESNESVIDITEMREEIINQERRIVKRTILTEFIGAFIIVPDRGLMKVTLYDVSDNGIAFDMDLTAGKFQVGEEVAMRVYLNHSTYFPFMVTISNIRMLEDDGVIRHGANFVKGSINDVALHHFIKFIETVSASLKKDEGDVLVSNIT